MHTKKFISTLLFLLLSLSTMADEGIDTTKVKEFEYKVVNTTEGQYNFSVKNNAKPKFIDLLRFDSSVKTDRMWKNGKFQLGLLCVAGSLRNRIADDDLTFSNIDAANNFNVSVLGYEHRFGNFNLFGGIRNMNIDYFASPYLSLFTNSATGIFPTLSMNYALANRKFH